MIFLIIISLLLSSLINVNSYLFKESYIAVWLSGAAYCNKENYMDMVLDGPANGFIVSNILYDKVTDLQGYIGIMPESKTIYVTFRGSSSILNWIVNLNFKKIPYDSYPECKCSVHEGFYKTTLNLKSSVIANINILKKKYNYNNVIITGHSLGAAIAQLMMMELNLNNIYSTVYNFGQPRVGDIKYANFVSFFYKENLNRFTHYKDVVPHIPPNEMDYYHSCNEIYENKNGNLYNCSTTNCEDPLCSDQFLLNETNTDDHSTYLGHNLNCEENTK